jgi:hypothetical protein
MSTPGQVKTNKKTETAAVHYWNRTYKTAEEVIVKRDNGDEFTTKTRGHAWMMGKRAVILVEGISGAYSLDRVRAVIPF